MPPSRQDAQKDSKKVKKPYHIPRSQLDLPSYIEERNSKSPAVLWERFKLHTVHSLQFRIYVFLQCLAAWFGFGQIMLLIGLAWGMLANTGDRKAGEKSAYSLFNDGYEAIMGSTNMEALEQELRSRGA